MRRVRCRYPRGTLLETSKQKEKKLDAFVKISSKPAILGTLIIIYIYIHIQEEQISQ